MEGHTRARGARTRARYQRLPCGVRGADGLTREQVEWHQRVRIYEAMVEITATLGYGAATIKAVSALANVSRRTFYDLFAAGARHPKEECFLGSYDYVVNRAIGRINQAYRDERDPRLRLCSAFQQFALEAATEPQAARFALVETLGAGPAALARMERGRRLFERLIAASVDDPAGIGLSPTLVKGIVGGVERVARAYLLAGRIDRLAGTADELSAWVSCYRPWRHRPPVEQPPVRTARPGVLGGRDEGLRIARAAAAIAARDGYGALTPTRICRLAGVSDETFARLYKGPDAIEACFMSALDLLGTEALVCAARAAERAGDGPDGVRAGIAALLDHVAAHPFLGRAAFIEVFAVGPSAIERRSALLGRFADALVTRMPSSSRPTELVGEAIIGGIWAVIHDRVVLGQAHRLCELVDDVAYLALTPMIGHDVAVRLIGGTGTPRQYTHALPASGRRSVRF